MKLTAFSAAILLPACIQAALDKQVLSNSGNSVYSKELSKAVKASKYTYKEWPADTIAQNCYDSAGSDDLITNITTYEVTYENCGQPWILCRHANASIKLTTMFDVWGKLPAKMKQSVTSALFLPSSARIGSLWAWTWQSDQCYYGGWSDMNVYVHENIHAMDYSNAFNQSGLGDSTIWKNAVKADTAVISGYALTSYGEDLAETGPVALYDTLVPGGAAAILPNITKMQNQLDTLKKQAKLGNYGGDAFSTSVNCTHRWPNPKQIKKKQPKASRFMARSTDEAYIEEARVKARDMGITLFNDVPGFKPKTMKKRTDCQ